jgi:hypothetical protein
MVEQLRRLSDRRSYGRTFAQHPAGRGTPSPPVLIIAQDNAAGLELERALPETIAARSVRAASETEGVGSRMVVIGGRFPLAELVEVRVHPVLFDKPVIVFAPGRRFPEMDWGAMDVRPVTTVHNPTGELVAYIRELLDPLGPSHVDTDLAGGSALRAR